MAKTKTFISYRGGVSITPAAGSALVLTEITDVSKVVTDNLLPWRADGHPFPTVMGLGTSDRGVTITSGDLAGMLAVPRLTACTVVAVAYDALNGVGAGALTETWTHAYVVDTPSSGPTNNYAGGTITFMCSSADGVTDPYSFAQA